MMRSVFVCNGDMNGILSRLQKIKLRNENQYCVEANKYYFCETVKNTLDERTFILYYCQDSVLIYQVRKRADR
jgi:hypothetical protein